MISLYIFKKNLTKGLVASVMLFILSTYCAISSAQSELSKIPEPSTQQVWVISYFEVKPQSLTAVESLVSGYLKNNQGSEGVLHIKGLQRVSRDTHFAIVEVWLDEQSRQAKNSLVSVKEFRNSLQQHLSAPYDERIHHALAVDESPQFADSNEATIYALTHVDIVRPEQFSPCSLSLGDDGLCANDLLSNLAVASRLEEGNYRFDVLTQSSRENHMTVLEAWSDLAAQQTHAASDVKIDFRFALSGVVSTSSETADPQEPLTSMMGSLYDERIYQVLDSSAGLKGN